MADNRDKCTEGDFALLGIPGPDGSVPVLRHRADHSLEAGALVPVRDGEPLVGELVRVRPRDDGPGFSVESLYTPSGPPLFNSRAYRDGWDAIWGRKGDQKRETASN